MCFNVIHLQLCEWPILYCTRYWNELICLLCTEAFRRLNLDPHRSPSTICTIPVNGDETQVQTEAMDVCITSNEVRNTPSQHVVIRLCKHKPIFAVLFKIFFTPLPTGEREVLWWVCVCVSVCLSVCGHISRTTRLIFTKFFVHVTYGRGLVLWPRSACDSVLMMWSEVLASTDNPCGGIRQIDWDSL